MDTGTDIKQTCTGCGKWVFTPVYGMCRECLGWPTLSHKPMVNRIEKYPPYDSFFTWLKNLFKAPMGTNTK